MSTCTFSKENPNCNCILHSQDINKDITQFWKAFKDVLEENIHYCEYEKVIFPKFEEENVKSIGKLKKHSITFKQCIFLEKADFREINSKEVISFFNCHFEKGIRLNNNINVHLGFIDCRFNGNDLDLYGKKFNNYFIFAQNKGIRKLNCTNTNFSTCNFNENRFEEVVFLYTKFNDKVSFIKTEFSDDITFQFTEFEKKVFFRDAIFHKKLDLRDAIFKDEVNFLDIKNQDGNKLESENISNRETARTIKHSFEKIDNIIEANNFYALEMEKRKEELTQSLSECHSIKKLFGNIIPEWIVFWFHRLSSNHSQNFLLPIFCIFVITGIYEYESFLCFYYNFSETKFISIFDLIANNINPFSIMVGESLSFTTLIYKSLIAYLIYQFIISIRQNTRRK